MTSVDDIAAHLARRALAETAPEELPLFRATSTAYFADPEGTLARRGGKDEMLGFGAEAAMVLVSPIALDVAKNVVTYVVDRIRLAVKSEGDAAIDGAVSRFFARLLGKDADSDDPSSAGDQGETRGVELTQAELQEIRSVAIEQARALDLPEAKAVLLADAVVGGLV